MTCIRQSQLGKNDETIIHLGQTLVGFLIDFITNLLFVKGYTFIMVITDKLFKNINFLIHKGNHS
jgi:hypothetical protein